VKKAEAVTGQWAVLPKPPVVKSVMPTAREQAVVWSYTLEPPQGKWFETDYDDSTWTKARAGFGTRGTPGATVRTRWNTGEIWLRREFTLDHKISEHLHLLSPMPSPGSMRRPR